MNLQHGNCQYHLQVVTWADAYTSIMGKGDPVHVKACEHVFQNKDIKIESHLFKCGTLWKDPNRSKDQVSLSTYLCGSMYDSKN